MDPQPPRSATPEVNDAASLPSPRTMGRRGWWTGLVVALLLCAGTAWLVWHYTRPAQQQGAGAGLGPGGSNGPGGFGGSGGPGGGMGRRGAPATTVGVATATATDLPVVIDALGTVTPQATVRVRPQASGVLQQVLFQEGQVVRRGDLLATIDPRPFEMSLMQVTGQLQRDEAQLEAARVTLQRFRTLLQQDSIARQEVDTQAALVKQLEATVVIARANEGTARLNLSYTRIAAPIGGRLGLRLVDVGNLVSSSDANGLVVITQESPIDVSFAVPQDQAPQFLQPRGAPPMSVTALDRTRADTLDTGVFSSLDNQVDTTTGTVRAKARFTNTQGKLFPNQFVNVRVQVRTIKDAVVVPVSAVRQGDNGNFAFVLNEDRTVTMRTVTRGLAMVDRVQITNGLKAGERVITEGADRLKDGARVSLPGEVGAGGGGAGGRRPGARQGAASAPAGGALDAAALPSQLPGSAAHGGDGAAGPRARDGAAAPGRPANGAGNAPPSQAAPPADRPAVVGPATPPTAQQRQRFLDQVKDDPEALARRKTFLEAIDRGDPQALERWRVMRERMTERIRQGGGGPGPGP